MLRLRVPEPDGLEHERAHAAVERDELLEEGDWIRQWWAKEVHYFLKEILMTCFRQRFMSFPYLGLIVVRLLRNVVLLADLHKLDLDDQA